ncbi:helix-turn-helix domain-containing protein [Streptomyces sp. NRRL S-813]|uniref:helix-turn-helix domain-containing protein n=1 Tax=Streptomyces sp. NRRL S-813 TaxID=1463919 RepID=UPI0004BEE550|nr:helix-turn-helix transcriptional regulator [Streptomyces sp. NRRL S-813]
MGAWQPLPDDLPPEVRHFVEQLRLLKDGTGLSLAALGARTAYSKSSWQRYLNAGQPPPRHAVAALCRVAGLTGADAERHTVRWEMAVKVWPRPAAVPEAGATDGAAQLQAKTWTYDTHDAYEARETHEVYEEVPTVPWWDRPEERPRPGPGGRLLLYAVVLLVALVLTAVMGTLALG